MASGSLVPIQERLGSSASLIPQQLLAKLKPVSLRRAPETVIISVFFVEIKDIKVTSILIMRFGTKRTVLNFVNIGTLGIIE